MLVIGLSLPRCTHGEQLSRLRLLCRLDLFDKSLELFGADFLARRERLQNIEQQQLKANEFREGVLCDPFFGSDSDGPQQEFARPLSRSPTLRPCKFFKYRKFGFTEANSDLAASCVWPLRDPGFAIDQGFCGHL
jgi:hypothetical protein